ncbi:MAG: putative toxin-antitoxin system toxin component, PIN family [Ectothiorhodospiraceae bacterium]|nr:putative toxin-antitoxin system toxin component, PIN family [Ectothiorhodospiraceae bacterium]
MKPINIVLDTNVLVSALKSKNGASFKLLSLIDNGNFILNISVPLFLEYEAVALRESLNLPLDKSDIEDILNYIAQVSSKREIFYLWRPYLKDPKDDLVLEVAVESRSNVIVTYNKKDFVGIDKFGIKALTSKEFLNRRGLLP